MSASILVTAVNAMEAALGAMSRGNGYARDYRGVQRRDCEWEGEQDLDLPMVWLAPRSSPAQSTLWGDQVLTDLFRHGSIFGVRVNIRGVTRPNGDIDTIEPWTEVQGDIHRALWPLKTIGTAPNVRIWWVGSDPQHIMDSAADGTLCGVSCVELYRVEWDHVGGDVTRYA